MFIIRKFFSFIFALILVLVFLAFLLALGLKFSFLNQNFYKDAFRKADIYNALVTNAAPAVFSMVGENASFGLGPLGTEEITKVLEETVKPQWLQGQVETAISNFFDFANGKNNDLNIVLALSEIKKSAAENLSGTFRAKMETLPTCTAEELKKLQSQNKEGGFSFNCKPSGASSQDLEEMVMSSVTGKDGLLSQLPDQFNIGEAILKKPGANESILRFFTIFGMVFRALSIALGILILLLALINRKYWPGMLKWLSIPLMIPAAIVLVLAVIAQIVATALIGGYLTVLPGALKSLATTKAITLIAQFFWIFEFYSGIILVGLIIILILAIILSKIYPKIIRR